MRSAGSSAQNETPVQHDHSTAEDLPASHLSEEGTARPDESTSDETSKEVQEAVTEDSSTSGALSSKASAARPDGSVVRLIEMANGSAGKLVNLLAKHFPAFRDETRFEGRKVRFMKRAQIFVADLWAAMNGKGYGAFGDIDHLTMFAGEFAGAWRSLCYFRCDPRLMRRRQTTAFHRCCIRLGCWCTAHRWRMRSARSKSCRLVIAGRSSSVAVASGMTSETRASWCTRLTQVCLG